MPERVRRKMQIPYCFGSLFQPARYKVYLGGRGGAKSHSIAYALVMLTRRKKLRVLCAREVQKSIDESCKYLVEEKIRELGLEWFFKSTTTKIRGLNGSEFLFLGLRNNPTKIKSTEGIDIAWVEEAESVSAFSLQLLTPTIRAKGSEIWFSYNPRTAADPVHAMFHGENVPPNAIIQHTTYRDNPWFPDVLKDEMEFDREHDQDLYDWKWEGKPLVRSDERVFASWKEESLVDEVPDNCLPRLGADWGLRDPAVLLECYVWKRGTRPTIYFSDEVYKVGASIDELPSLFAGTDWRDRRRWENRHGHRGIESARKGSQIIADSSRPDINRYLRERGFNIVGAKRGPRSIEEGVEFIRAHDIYVNPKCRHLIQELNLYRYKRDLHTDEILGTEFVDKNNHTIDSARYALESVRRAQSLGPIAATAPEVIEMDAAQPIN